MKAMPLVVRRPRPSLCITKSRRAPMLILLRGVIRRPARRPRRSQAASAVLAAPRANRGIRAALIRREDDSECRGDSARIISELSQTKFRCRRRATHSLQASESRFHASAYLHSRHKRIEAAAFLYQFARSQRYSMPSAAGINTATLDYTGKSEAKE